MLGGTESALRLEDEGLRACEEREMRGGNFHSQKEVERAILIHERPSENIETRSNTTKNAEHRRKKSVQGMKGIGRMKGWRRWRKHTEQSTG